MPQVDYNASKSQFEKVADYFSVVLLVLLFIYTAKNFSVMPETVPTHFNIKGQADGWGSKWFIWFLPFVGVFTYGILLLAEKLPQFMNYPIKITEENAQRQFLLARMFLKTLKLALVLMFCLIQYAIIRMMLQNGDSLGIIIIFASISLVFIPIAFYFYLAVKAK